MQIINIMDKEKYKKRIGKQVQSCIKEMFKLFKKNNLTEMTFDTRFAPKLLFFKDSGEVCPQMLKTLRYVPETDSTYERFDVIGSKGWEGYLMKFGGDNFDVACQIGAIYEMVVKDLQVFKKSMGELPF